MKDARWQEKGTVAQREEHRKGKHELVDRLCGTWRANTWYPWMCESAEARAADIGATNCSEEGVERFARPCKDESLR